MHSSKIIFYVALRRFTFIVLLLNWQLFCLLMIFCSDFPNESNKKICAPGGFFSSDKFRLFNKQLLTEFF